MTLTLVNWYGIHLDNFDMKPIAFRCSNMVELSWIFHPKFLQAHMLFVVGWHEPTASGGHH